MASSELDQATKECTLADALKAEPNNHLNLLSEATIGLPRPSFVSINDKANQTASVTAFEIYDSAQPKIDVVKDVAAAVKPVDNSGAKPDSSVYDKAQSYTVSQLLQLPPEKLPHNFILQAEAGAAPQVELDRFKSSYDKKYGLSLGWAAELSADTARTNLLFTSDNSAQPAIAQTQYEPTQSETKLESDARHSRCIKHADQQIENEKLGLPAEANAATQANRRMALTYNLDARVSPERAKAILEARLYGIDESLPVQKIEKLTNHPGQKRWAEVLQIAPNSTTEQIMQAQKEQTDKYAAGLTGQERSDAEHALRTYWDAISLGLPDPEQATAEQVTPLIMDLQRQEETVAMGLDPNTSLIDISYQQEIRRLKLSPDTSQEDVERIRKARELRLPDQATAEEVNELEASWTQRKVELEQDCQN